MTETDSFYTMNDMVRALRPSFRGSQKNCVVLPGLRAHKGNDDRIYYYIDFRHKGHSYYTNLGPISLEQALAKWQEVRELAVNLQLALPPPSPAATMMTIAEVADLYLRSYESEIRAQKVSDLGYRTAKRNIYRAKRFDWFWNQPAAMIGPREIERLRNELLVACSGRTVRNTFCDLRTAFNYGMKPLGVVRTNPIDGRVVSSIPVDDQEFFELSPIDDVKLCRAAGVPWIWPAILLALDLGLRQGSVVGIKTSDLHLGEELLHVAVLKGKRRKKKASEWKPLPTTRLRKAIQDQLERAAIAGSEWLFPNPRDPRRHIAEQSVLKNFQKACKAAGFGKPKFHHLRHIWNTRAAHVLKPEIRRAISSHETKQASDLYTHLNTRAGALSIRRDASQLDKWLTKAGWKPLEFVTDRNGNSVEDGSNPILQ